MKVIPKHQCGEKVIGQFWNPTFIRTLWPKWKKKTFHFHVLSQAYDIMHMLKAHFIIAYMIYMTSLQKLNATHKNHHELFISLTHGGWKRQTSPIITADSNRDNAVIPLLWNIVGSCVYCIKTPFKTSACYSPKTTMHACLYKYTYSHTHINCQNNVIVNVGKYICANIKWSTGSPWTVK